MPESPNPHYRFGDPARYIVSNAGSIDPTWSEWSDPIPFDAGDGHQYGMCVRYRQVTRPPRPWWRRLLDRFRH